MKISDVGFLGMANLTFSWQFIFGVIMAILVCKHNNFFGKKTEADLPCSSTKLAILDEHNFSLKMFDLSCLKADVAEYSDPK